MNRLQVLALMLFATAAEAQVPVGSELRIDVDGAWPAVYRMTPREVAPAPGGDFVVAWTAYSGSYDYDVAGRVVSAAGRGVTPAFRVNSFTPARQYNHAVATDADGNFIVVWMSGEQDGSSTGIFAQRFAARGARIGGEFQVNVSTLDPQVRPGVAMTAAGAVVVVWADFRARAIMARRFDSAGNPVSGEFQVSAATTNTVYPEAPSVDVDAAGNFVVVWGVASPMASAFVSGRRFDASGAPQGSEFVVNTVSQSASRPRVARRDDGGFVVAWWGIGAQDPSAGIFGRRFDSVGVPLGPDFLVNQFTTGDQRTPDVDMDADGDFVIVWASEGRDGSWTGVAARSFDATGAGGPEFLVNSYTTNAQFYPSVGSDPAGNFVVAWHGATPEGDYGVFARRFARGPMGTALAVDEAPGPSSDVNGVLEAGESVVVAPAWLNATPVNQPLTGDGSAFGGPGTPGDPAYALVDAAAAYGPVPSGAIASCLGTGDCLGASIGVPTARPARHWDAALREDVTPSTLRGVKRWTLHVGESFTDVARTNPFYGFVETVFHHGVTGSCSATSYCPSAATGRAQMAVFVLVAKEGAYRPPACTAPARFSDVPAGDPFCPWVEELAERGVVAGCGGGNFCPTTAVSREQMAVFVLRALDPALAPQPCGAPVFDDVPASSPFCRWVEELARRGVVAGCGAGGYCPAAPVARGEMAVFVSVTFGLTLYGP